MTLEIIAEAAQGYEGDPSIARLLVRGAIQAKADAIKMQLVYADELATPDYQHYGLFKKLEMTDAVWQTLIGTAHKAGLKFYFDVFGLHSLEVAITLKADAVKVHSTDFFNTRLLQTAFQKAPFVFISLGGISAQELKTFIHQHQLTPKSAVCFLYGFQGDPTPIASNQMLRLKSLSREFPGFRFGFMDHAESTTEEAQTLSLLALPLGVQVIEKHITLDRSLELEDFISALPPDEFAQFVKRVKSLEQALGKETLDLAPEEQQYRSKVIKVVVATRPLRKGDRLTVANIALKRTSKPLQPGTLFNLEEAIDKPIKMDLSPHEPLSKEMLS